jgi:hypothetical protein
MLPSMLPLGSACDFSRVLALAFITSCSSKQY